MASTRHPSPEEKVQGVFRDALMMLSPVQSMFVNIY